MQLLLDTSVVLYILKYPDRIGKSALATMQDADQLYVSVASLWEVAIKSKKGKLQIVLPISNIPALIGAKELPISSSHTDAYCTIELPHKDPFDTMLIAQAKAENLSLVTSDKTLLDCSYPTLDATQ